MFGLFRKRQKEHPCRRELYGLMSSIVAWRRAVLEYQARDQPSATEELEQRRDHLLGYRQGVGDVSPFAELILTTPVGQLGNDLMLLALYRIETAASIAWALQLLETLPPTIEGIGHEKVSGLFPIDGSSGWSKDDVQRRDGMILSHALEDWRSKLSAARENRNGSEDRELQFSRAFERTRGLAWVCDNTPWVEDTEPT